VGTIEGPTDGMTGPIAGPMGGPMSGQSGTPGRDPGTWSADTAISALYAAHWRGLVRLASLLVHDQQVAEDVAQEAFVATYRRWSSLRSPEAAVAYLRTATVNGSRSALRKRGVRERYAALRAAAPDLERHVDSAESFALAAHHRAEVVAVLDGLPSRQREVLVLRYYLDLSESDIAETLGISRGAVKSHASRAMSALRQRLATRTEPEDLS
jgi:RNA polymerase sigma-70 factor (sigma-E family)